VLCVLRLPLPGRLSTVPNFLSFTSSLLMLFFVQPLSGNCHKLLSVVTFTFMQSYRLQNFVFFTKQHHLDRQRDTYFSSLAAMQFWTNIKQVKKLH